MTKINRKQKIVHNLMDGEQVRIASITGFTPRYVNMVINGTRKSDKITKCAELIVDHRTYSDSIIKQELKKLFKKQA